VSADPGSGRTEGTVVRVSGPLVEIEGLQGVALFDVVELGSHALAGEVVAIRGDTVVAQAYEYTGGIAPGAPAASNRRPLSVGLGPGLLGGDLRRAAPSARRRTRVPRAWVGVFGARCGARLVLPPGGRARGGGEPGDGAQYRRGRGLE